MEASCGGAGRGGVGWGGVLAVCSSKIVLRVKAGGGGGEGGGVFFFFWRALWKILYYSVAFVFLPAEKQQRREEGK